jgi:hypothetical protein
MDAKELLDDARDALTVRRVLGDPFEKGGLTVTPVASVMGCGRRRRLGVRRGGPETHLAGGHRRLVLRLLAHNRHDCAGMREVCLRVTRELEEVATAADVRSSGGRACPGTAA